MWQRVTCHKLKWHVPLTYRQKIKHGKTVHVCWEQSMDTFFQEMLGGVGWLLENVGVTLFLKDRDKKPKRNYKPHAAYKQLRQRHSVCFERRVRCQRV